MYSYLGAEVTPVLTGKRSVEEMSKEVRIRERSEYNTAKEIMTYEAINANQPVTKFNINDLHK
jgi:hypothetical protein